MNPWVLLLVLVVFVITVVVYAKTQIKRADYKQVNNELLSKKGTKEEYYFFNEKSGNVFMFDTDSGELFYGTTVEKTDLKHMKKEYNLFTKSTDRNDYKKISDNYYDIIEKNISFNVESLLE